MVFPYAMYQVMLGIRPNLYEREKAYHISNVDIEKDGLELDGPISRLSNMAPMTQ